MGTEADIDTKRDDDEEAAFRFLVRGFVVLMVGALAAIAGFVLQQEIQRYAAWGVGVLLAVVGAIFLVMGTVFLCSSWGGRR